jgi:hypothetical protein
MGCDIHTVAQIFKDGEWRTAEHRVADDERNYDTFAVYANVRNGSGFAGCDTGVGWRVIAEPRGLPEGFHMWEETHHGTWMGDHSYSWLLLPEIQKAFDGYEGQTYEVHGVLERGEYEKTIAQGKRPTEWCGMTSGPSVLVVEEKSVKDGTAPSRYTHVQCAWKVPAQDRLRTMKAQLEELKWLPEEYEVSPDQVRLVFGFDS